MAIEVGNTSKSGNPGTVNTAYNWLHTVAADSNVLFVIMTTRESTDADRVVSGVTYDGNPLDLAFAYISDVREMTTEIWYLVDPTVSSELTIEVTYTGKVTDGGAQAVDFSNVNTDTIPVETDGADANGTGKEFTLTSGDAILAGGIHAESSVGNIDITLGGTQIGEDDYGNYSGQSGFEIGDLNLKVASTNLVNYACAAISFDEESGVENLSIGINDTISTTESVATFFDLLRIAISDSVSLTEFTQRLFDKIVVDISDTISVVEYIESLGQLSISVTDSVTAAEGITPTGKSLADIYDSIEIAEALESLGFLSRDINDSISISEALSFLGLLSISINDSISIVENLAKSIVALGFDTDINDSITVAEFLGTLGYSYTNINDTITVAEALTFLGQLITDINDSITISESLNFLGYLAAIVSDNITITENIARLTTSYQTVNDSVSVNEALGFFIKLQTSINDSLSVTEALTFLGLLNTDISDVVVIVENLANNIYTSGNLTANINDSITISEFLEFTGYLQISINDAITVIDLISTGEADGFFRRPWCRRLSGPFGRGDVFQS